MENEKREMIIGLFNDGTLSVADAEYLNKKGYSFIVNDGLVTDIVPE